MRPPFKTELISDYLLLLVLGIAATGFVAIAALPFQSSAQLLGLEVGSLTLPLYLFLYLPLAGIEVSIRSRAGSSGGSENQFSGNWARYAVIGRSSVLPVLLAYYYLLSPLLMVVASSDRGFGTVVSLRKGLSVIYNDKPVIYLYPMKPETITVSLTLHGSTIAATYPPIDPVTNSWRVLATPEGTLRTVEGGRKFGSLFWDSTVEVLPPYDLSSGWVIEGAKSREFLEEILPQFGLNEHEANEMIVYWYPRLLRHRWNQVYFAGHEYQESAELKITPKPDSILRVFLVTRPLKEPRELKFQSIPRFVRRGFTVVEWGGIELPAEVEEQ
jgi:hypothetical protein